MPFARRAFGRKLELPLVQPLRAGVFRQEGFIQDDQQVRRWGPSAWPPRSIWRRQNSRQEAAPVACIFGRLDNPRPCGVVAEIVVFLRPELLDRFCVEDSGPAGFAHKSFRSNR